ncbi:hypothetical protein K438DRAFT_1763859 [Mycena galopus ATCC 62051]|nr:hypothetical protein K438DRAFT_1763859 [Mycena galopus ATCC 62051]
MFGRSARSPAYAGPNNQARPRNEGRTVKLVPTRLKSKAPIFNELRVGLDFGLWLIITREDPQWWDLTNSLTFRPRDYAFDPFCMAWTIRPQCPSFSPLRDFWELPPKLRGTSIVRVGLPPVAVASTIFPKDKLLDRQALVEMRTEHKLLDASICMERTVGVEVSGQSDGLFANV